MFIHILLLVMWTFKNTVKNKYNFLTFPDKGNVVAVLDRTACNSGILNILNDKSEYKNL